MKLNKTGANFLMLLTTIIWGSSFIVVKYLTDLGCAPGFIVLVRAGIALLLCAFFIKKLCKMTKADFFANLPIALSGFLGFIIQTIAIQYTSPSKSAFLTVTNVIMVPFLVWIFSKQMPPVKTFIAALLSIAGTYFITGGLTGGGFNIGDGLTLVCAMMFAVNIFFIGHAQGKTSWQAMTFYMALFQTIGGAAYFLLAEGGIVAVDLGIVMPPLVYLAVVGTWFTMILQVVAQKHTSAESAAIILSLEGIFATVFSVIFGFEALTLGLFVGGVLIMLGIFLQESRAISN